MKHGTNFCIGTQPDPNDRINIKLSENDERAFNYLPPGPSNVTVWVRDLRTNTNYHVRRADCGLGNHCYCAAELVAEPKAPELYTVKLTVAERIFMLGVLRAYKDGVEHEADTVYEKLQEASKHE